MTDRKQKLIQLLEALQDKQAWIWSMLDEDQRERSGSVEEWAPKDHLAHANFWTERVISQLQIALEKGDTGRLEGFNKTNEETFEQFKDQSWQEIHLWSEKVHGELTDSLGRVSAEAMEDPERFEWTNHRPLWNEVVFTAVYHRVQHAGDILSLCGLDEHVRPLQEQFAEMMEQLDDSERWRGTAIYNLACYYALDEKPDLALEALGRAFKFNPDLREWSKQDQDLDSLRESDDFQALIDG